MSNDKQSSSIEWLTQQVLHLDWQFLTQEKKRKICKQAKAMHKEEILYAIEWGNRKGYDEHKLTCIHDEDEQYYNNQFGDKNEQ